MQEIYPPLVKLTDKNKEGKETGEPGPIYPSNSD